MAQKFMAEFSFCSFRRPTEHEIRRQASDSTVTRRHYVFALGRDEAFILRFRA